MAVFAVRYTYILDAERTDAVRPEHRAFLRGLAGRGALLVAGAFAPGEAPGAQLAVIADTADDARRLLADDPFAREGIITDVSVTEWRPVVGPWADLLVEDEGAPA